MVSGHLSQLTHQSHYREKEQNKGLSAQGLLRLLTPGARVNSPLRPREINLSNKHALSQFHSYKQQGNEGKDTETYFLMNVLKKENQSENILLGSLFTGAFQDK